MAATVSDRKVLRPIETPESAMTKESVPTEPAVSEVQRDGAAEAAGFRQIWPLVERRGGEDRRGGPTRLFSRFIFAGRRARGRRRGERSNIYVDRYNRKDVMLAGGVLILNIFDAFFTLIYVLNAKGREANPVAQFLMDADPENHFWFLFSKSVVVLFCVLFLVMHKTFKLVRPALVLLLGFYGALFVYHIVLQLQVFRNGGYA